MEFDEAVTTIVKTEEPNDENRSLMVIIVAAIIGVLVLVVVVMVVRVFVNKRNIFIARDELIGDEKNNDNLEVEPQFVLAADDSKNIFGRPSTAPLGQDIERSEIKKSGSSENRRRKKKVVLRKITKPSTVGEVNNDDSVEDDGFRNYE